MGIGRANGRGRGAGWRRGRARMLAGLPVAGLVLAAGLTLCAIATGCQRSALIQQPFDDVSQSRIDRPLSREDCLADLAELSALVERATPSPFLHRPREQVEGTFRRLGDALPESMSRRQFVGVLREACAAYGIGHQYAVFPHEDFNAWADAGGLSPSVRIGVRDGALVVRDPAGLSLPEGARVTEFSGWRAEELLNLLRQRTSADTPAQRDDAIEGRFATLLWELGLEAPYEIVALAPGGTEQHAVDPGAAPARRESMFAQRGRSGEDRPASEGPNFSLFWPTPTIACIRWTTMDPRESEAWEAFLLDAASQLEERGAEGLIVDLRSNVGGTSTLTRPLLGMLSDRPARMAGGKLWRKSEDYDRFLESCVVWWARGLGWRSQFSAEYASMDLGEERLLEAPEPAPFAFAGPRFTGTSVVLIGPRTFSSAVMVADAVATHDLATLAGRPTGGVPNAHGEVGFTRLARSGLIVSFSSAQFIRASGDATDTSPVTPDVTLEPGTRADGTDAEVAAAVRLIEAR